MVFLRFGCLRTLACCFGGRREAYLRGNLFPFCMERGMKMGILAYIRRIIEGKRDITGQKNA
jgi:hypothetical protein